MIVVSPTLERVEVQHFGGALPRPEHQRHRKG